MRALTRSFAVLAIALLSASAHAAADLPPPVGSIDFYGLGPIPRAKAAALLPFKLGEQVPRGSPKRNGDPMARALGVSRVEFAFICCAPDGKVEAYVGIEPRGREPQGFNSAPAGDVKLPASIVEAYDKFLSLLPEAVRSGNGNEDDSQGHALAVYPPLREQQEKFIVFAREHEELLRDALANAAEKKMREVAADVLGYAPDKRTVVEPLTRAARDPEKVVRNNATRALGVIADYAAAHPELGIRIDPAPFIEMLNSVVWTDRNKGSFVLMSLSATRDPALLATLRRDALPALTDMCGWSNLGHAASACLMLQRALGLADDLGEQNRALALKRARQILE